MFLRRKKKSKKTFGRVTLFAGKSIGKAKPAWSLDSKLMTGRKKRRAEK